MKKLLLAIFVIALLGCENSTVPKPDPIPDPEPPKPNTAMSYFKDDTVIYRTDYFENDKFVMTLNYDTLYYSTIDIDKLKYIAIYKDVKKNNSDLYVYQFIVIDDSLILGEINYNQNNAFNDLAFTTNYKTDTVTFNIDKSKSIYLSPADYVKIAKNNGIIEIKYTDFILNAYEIIKRIN